MTAKTRIYAIRRRSTREVLRLVRARQIARGLRTKEPQQ